MGSSPTGPTMVMSQDIGMTPEPTLSGFGVLGSSGGVWGSGPAVLYHLRVVREVAGSPIPAVARGRTSAAHL